VSIKITGPSKKQRIITHYQNKKQPIETDPKKEIMEFIDKDLKTNTIHLTNVIDSVKRNIT
jgi:hypothetical protein